MVTMHGTAPASAEHEANLAALERLLDSDEPVAREVVLSGDVNPAPAVAAPLPVATMRDEHQIRVAFDKIAALESQLALLRTLLDSGRVKSVEFGCAAPSPALVEPPALVVPPALVEPVASVAPPPPPPPPPYDWKPQRLPSSSVEKAPPVLTDAQIDELVAQEIRLSSLSSLVQPKALHNFCCAFSPKTRSLLRMLALEYPFLIRALPLRPVECVRRATEWQRFLRTFDDREAAALRQRHQMQIVMTEPADIQAAIGKVMITGSMLFVLEILKDCVFFVFFCTEQIRATIEARKRKEAEAKAAGSTRGELLKELSTVFAKGAAEEERARAERELACMVAAQPEELEGFLSV